MASRTVLYAIDGNRLYHKFLEWSLRSLRFHSPRIEVRVCSFGVANKQLRRLCREVGAQLTVCEAVAPELRWGLKWLALREVETFQRVFFADADTYFWGPIEDVFDVCLKHEFYAAREFGTDSQARSWRSFDRCPFDFDKLVQLQREMGASAYPVFNSSFMLFNRGSHRKIVKRLGDLVFLVYRLNAPKRSNPLRRRWRFMAEEVAGSIVLGLKPAIPYDFFPQNLLGHYNWWVRLGRGSMGNCLHIGGDHGAQMMREFGCPIEADAWLKLYMSAREKRPPVVRQLSARK